MKEKKFSFEPKIEREPKIIIRRPNEAPYEQKQNPLYDSEIFGQAPSPDNIFVPDSDEAISFPIAAHEIGHLVAKGKNYNIKILDDFKEICAEELRAWEEGWAYLEKYLLEYYQDNPDTIPIIQQAHEQIKELWMRVVKLMKTYYSGGIPDGLSEEEENEIIKEKQEMLFLEKGEEIKLLFEKIKEQKIGRKPNWDKLVDIVTRAVKDILRDNKKFK